MEADANKLPPLFEVGKHTLQFDCEWAVYPKGGKSSLCYVTDKARAHLIAEALDYFAEAGKLDAWIDGEMERSSYRGTEDTENAK